MKTVTFISKDDCHLCDVAKSVIVKVQKKIAFDLKEKKITPGDPEFETYHERVPVVLIDEEFAFQVQGFGTATAQNAGQTNFSPLKREDVRMKILSKTLEAVGMASVMIGLIDGINGSMWLELYLLIIGLVIFFAGWGIEKSLKKNTQSQKVQ